MNGPGAPTRRATAAWLAAIVLAAGALRLAGLGWDDGSFLHPDERYVAMVATSIGRTPSPPTDPAGVERHKACLAAHPSTGGAGPWLDSRCGAWSPKVAGHGDFPYGLLPVAAVKAAAFALEAAGVPRATGMHAVVLAGRVASTLADLVALLCAYLLGRALGGRRAGLAAAALYGLAWLPLQHARFFVVDPFAAAFASMALVFALRIAARGLLADAVAFGLAIGLAIATKLSLAPLAALVVPAMLLAPGPGGTARALARTTGATLLAALAAFAIVRVAQPIWFAGPGLLDVGPAPGFLDFLVRIGAQVDGSADSPPAWQWIGRTRVVDPLRNLVLYGLGPVLALASLAGMALALRRVIRDGAVRRRAAALLLLATLGFLLWITLPFVSGMRYALPVYAALAAFGGWALAVGTRALARRWRGWRVLPAAALAVALVAACAWLAIPLSAPTRLWASHWMLERVPTGASARFLEEASGPLPRRVNWPVDGTLAAEPTRARTTTTIAGTIDAIELRLQPAADATKQVRVVASLVADDGTVLLAPTALDAALATPPPPGHDARDRVLVARLPAPIVLTAGRRIDLALATEAPGVAVAGTPIATEGAWDDPVPMRMRRLPPGTLVEPGFPGRARGGAHADGVDPFGQRYFPGVDLGMVARDDEAKRARLADALERATWITISSQRFHDAVSRDPYRFPLTNAWYDALFAGRLGFDVVAVFRSPPRLGDFAFDPHVHPWPGGYAATRARADRNPEEAWSVYDHPPVTILRKRASFDAGAARAELARPILRTLEDARRDGAPTTVGRVERRPSEADLAPDLLMLPPARLAALDAKPAAPVAPTHALVDVVAWYVVTALLGTAAWAALASLLPAMPALAAGLARVAGLAAFAGSAWWATRFGFPWGDRTALALLAATLALAALAFAARRRARPSAEALRELVRAEAVFAVLFLAALALRASNPDLWTPGYGGEKPMDFALLNAVIGTDAFPPPDPWFAGGRVNYYYGGFVPIAALASLAGTAPAVAVNLALALWMALAGTAIFGVARALALAASWPGVRATAAGIVSTLAAIGAGNLGIVHALVASPPGGAGTWNRIVSFVTTPDPRWYWHPTRLVAERAGGHEIHEFPFFSFLHADPHAHLLALPLTVAAFATLVAAWLAPPRSTGARIAGLVLAAAIAAGARAVNSWDWPLATALAGVAVASVALGGARDAAAVRRALGSLCAFVLLQVAFAWPFASTFVTGGLGVTPYRGPGTPLPTWFVGYGAFLWVLVPWLALGAGPAERATASRTPASAHARLALLVIASAAAVAALAGLARTAIAGGIAPAAPAMLAVAALALREVLDDGARASRRTIATIVAVALALQLVPEYAVVARDTGRQNTYFKFHLPAWIALSLALGPALVALLARGTGRAWRAGAVGLAALALAYVPVGVASRAAARFEGARPWTLDGLAFLADAKLDRGGRREALADDRAIVAWLAAHAPRGAVVLEAQLPEYQYGSRIASFTGLPTIVGYRWHQTQQRPLPPLGDLVNLRVANVDAIWRGPDLDRAWTAIVDYRVAYAVVGPLERLVYPADALARFDRWVAEGRASVAWRSGASVIYAFDRRPVGGWPAF